ncbi:hypothetical protein [Sporanaerobacter acetigenes]|uniref:hypothetical protein n=1 Tax=Sporanaerobacter acetigenes TaxID=165813 RepID=UPI00331A1BA0
MLCFEFIYILDPEIYTRYLKRGVYKYVPKVWLKKMKPKEVVNFTNEKGDVLGKGIGVFLENNEKTKEEYINGVIDGVEVFKSEQTGKILYDDIYIFNRKDRHYIREKTGLEIADGMEVLIYFLPYVLKELLYLCDEKLWNSEILMVSDGSNLPYKLIERLSKEVRFLTILEDKKENAQKNIDKIYNDTGLSIFYSQNVDKILMNYNIIINFKDNISVDTKKLRGKTIVFDLSVGQNFSEEINNINKSVITIEDFLFHWKDLIVEKDFFHTEELIPSYKYEVFNRYDIKDFKQVLVKNEKYTLEELVQTKIRNRIHI